MRDKGESGENEVRDRGESGEDEVRDKRESGEDEGRVTWQVFGKIKHHMSLRFFFSKSESLLISSHRSILVSYRHLCFFISPPSRPLASGLTWCHPAMLNFGVQH